MELLIKINCQTKAEMFAHLMVIKQQLKYELKPVGDYEAPGQELSISDENIYGSHEATINL